MAVDASFMESVAPESDDLQSLSAEDFLRTVGRRVRQHRSRSRMSRKRLAELSGVSERYLAQLESGQGNMSIILLRRVSTAIELPLDVLMSDRGPGLAHTIPGPVVDSRHHAPMCGPMQGSAPIESMHEMPRDARRQPEFG